MAPFNQIEFNVRVQYQGVSRYILTAPPEYAMKRMGFAREQGPVASYSEDAWPFGNIPSPGSSKKAALQSPFLRSDRAVPVLIRRRVDGRGRCG
jgi:hypothetical protein